jgi:hypothetical protein
MVKSGPEPIKGDSWSVTPFVCASLAECIFLVILRVMLVSIDSGVEYENMPSYTSPDFVVIVTDVPYGKKAVSDKNTGEGEGGRFGVNLQWLLQEGKQDDHWHACRGWQYLSAVAFSQWLSALLAERCHFAVVVLSSSG